MIHGLCRGEKMGGCVWLHISNTFFHHHHHQQPLARFVTHCAVKLFVKSNLIFLCLFDLEFEHFGSSHQALSRNLCCTFQIHFFTIINPSPHSLPNMAVRVVEFSNGYTKLERFLHKNQHPQRKLLNFENWTNGEPQ